MNQELLNRIKDEVAKERYSRRWTSLGTSQAFLWEEVCDRYSKAYAKECIKASLEKAADMADYFTDSEDNPVIIRSSVTDPENIVLL